uniref:Uncharacterized protein n=1 Tax=Brassica oleracea var. oleracea TaxID=109376 RepID=A0A0D3CEU5_BRAOL
MQHEQNREEMDAQDRFFSESIKQIYDNRDAKEEDFKMLQQQERAKVVEQQQKKNVNLSSKDELRKIAEEVSGSIELQEKDMEEFVEEREKMIEEAYCRSMWSMETGAGLTRALIAALEESKGCVTSLIKQGCASGCVVHVRYKTPMKRKT